MTSTAATIWSYAARSIERLIAVAFEDLDSAGRAWHPDVPDANSVLALLNHTISNAEDNLLGTVLGQSLHYDRQADFDTPTASQDAIHERWNGIRSIFEAALPTLDNPRLAETMQHPRRGPVTRLDILIVVARHAAEHLAHAELTRDFYRAQIFEGGVR